MSKNKSLNDVLLQRSLVGLMHLAPSGTETCTVIVKHDSRVTPLTLPTTIEKLLVVRTEVGDEGKLKITVKLSDEIKKVIDSEIYKAKETLIVANDGMSDYSKTKDRVWKHYIKKTRRSLRSMIAEAAYAKTSK